MIGDRSIGEPLLEVLVHGGGQLLSVFNGNWLLESTWWCHQNVCNRIDKHLTVWEKMHRSIRLISSLSPHSLLTWKSSFICLSSMAVVTAAGALWDIILHSPWNGKRKKMHAEGQACQRYSELTFWNSEGSLLSFTTGHSYSVLYDKVTKLSHFCLKIKESNKYKFCSKRDGLHAFKRSSEKN